MVDTDEVDSLVVEDEVVDKAELVEDEAVTVVESVVGAATVVAAEVGTVIL